MEPQTQTTELKSLQEVSQEKIKMLGPNDYHQYYGHWFMWILVILAFFGVIAGLIGLAYVLFFRLL